MTYEQTQLLAMELGRSHVGGLVQIITDSWSMTGTLSRVDQHDNREWEINYEFGRTLVPSGGEIYTELWIGPWRGRVIGNQPVTVERVKGTLEAPERGPFYESNLKAIQEEIDTPLFPGPLKDYADTGGVARATAPRREGLRDRPLDDGVTHLSIPDEGVTRCGLDWWSGGVVLALTAEAATCRECRRRDGIDKVRRGEWTVNRAREDAGLPPAPPDWPDLPGHG